MVVERKKIKDEDSVKEKLVNWLCGINCGLLECFQTLSTLNQMEKSGERADLEDIMVASFLEFLEAC